MEKADVKDPQYETLNGLGEDLFKDEKKEDEGKKKEFKQPEKVQKADAKDPQYETLNEVDKGIFNNEEKPSKNENKNVENKD